MKGLLTTLISLVLFVCVGSQAQQAESATPTNAKDQASILLINRSLAAMGGSQPAAIADFVATGDVTYYWAGKEEKGSATLSGRGIGQFRFDANLAGGTRSWAVNNGTGALRDTNGKITTIPFHNAINLGSLTFPMFRLAELASDTAVTLSYSGPAEIESQQFECVHTHKQLFDKDPEGSGNRLGDADLYFDPNTKLLVGIHDQSHPKRTMSKDVAHAVYFGDYRQVSGLLVPFTISEYLGQQKVWSLQISDIKFNTGLSDDVFILR
jgi:hypothetical protein